MTPGLAFFYAGMVSTKNVISTMLQSFIALGVITPALVTGSFRARARDVGSFAGETRTFLFTRSRLRS